jgi:PKD repeat protein
MKNSIKIILLLGLVLAACTKADENDRKNVGTLTLPVASFYYSGNENPAPVTVQFHNTSQYSDEFLWTFHNGATSTEHSPSFTYPAIGEDKSYIVKLKATDSNSGESNIRSKSILILSSK